MIRKYIFENISGPDMFHLVPDGSQNILQHPVGNKSLPEFVIFINIIFKVPVDHGPVIAPGVTAKEFITSPTGKASHGLFLAVGAKHPCVSKANQCQYFFFLMAPQ